MLCPSPADLPNPRIKPRSPALQADSLLSEPPGKPMNTGVGSLSLLPGDLPYPVIEQGSPALQADSLPDELPRKPIVKISTTFSCHNYRKHLGNSEVLGIMLITLYLSSAFYSSPLMSSPVSENTCLNICKKK